MVASSRFTEHFDLEQDSTSYDLTSYKYNNTSHSNQTLSHVGSDQCEYFFEGFYRRQSLANTINSVTSNYSINEQCSLRRQSHVRTRRQSENSLVSSFTINSVNNGGLVGWCLRQRSKITTKLYRL